MTIEMIEVEAFNSGTQIKVIGVGGGGGNAVEHIQEPGLARLHHNVERTPVVGDGHQRGRGDEIVIPQVMVDGLEMPTKLPRCGVKRDQRVCVQVVAYTSGAKEIVGRGAERDVNNASFVIHRHSAPGIHAAAKGDIDRRAS